MMTTEINNIINENRKLREEVNRLKKEKLDYLEKLVNIHNIGNSIILSSRKRITTAEEYDWRWEQGRIAAVEEVLS
jgi:hypothetical protein